MSIRVVARIRPKQQNEDAIVSTASSSDDSSVQPTLVKIPNPKNEGENFTFQFSSVYDHQATQQQIFEQEVAPTIKHLFNGLDVTIFAYGSTGTGKTHTMRGGKTLAERGIIPRLLSSIYRRARKIDKDSAGKTRVDISLSYYEIYNDKVFDLFETPERRSLAGLPLRDNGTKTVVVGLTERPCESLKDFERLYDQANVNRSTSATKLNAASSRSHAILGISVAITTGDEVRTSTASAIDLAGSEDNRRTENGKERMVESASINKSLFTLAKCVEAISQGASRVPYRESKMTRILSLGQNNGLTIMILNLAAVRSYHLDTLSSLNFANRTKKIEVREVENEPIFKGCSRAVPTFTGASIKRQPLRPLASTVHNVAINPARLPKPSDKPKAFSVYSDRVRQSNAPARPNRIEQVGRSSPLKRPSDPFTSVSRARKRRSPARIALLSQSTMSKQAIEDIIERKVTDILAARALDQTTVATQPEISDEVQRRLELLEQRIESKDDGREQGLTFLLMAKQHAVRGEDGSALKMYTLAKDFFPDNKRLDVKIERLRERMSQKRQDEGPRRSIGLDKRADARLDSQEDDYHKESKPTKDEDCGSNRSFHYEAKSRKANQSSIHQLPTTDIEEREVHTPRTEQLLCIVNSRDVSQIRLLKGVGARKAESIVDALCSGESGEAQTVHSLRQLSGLRGVGVRTVDNMRAGLRPSLGAT